MVNGPGRGRLQYMSFLAGAGLGGLTSGVILVIIGLFVPAIGSPLAAGVIAALTMAAMARDLGIIRLHLPQNGRQVRQSVIGMPAVTGSLMFGFELGTGMRTFVTGAAPYVLVIAIVVAADRPTDALLAGAAYGVGRGLLPIDRALPRDSDAWDQAVRNVAARALPAFMAAVVGAAAAAAVLLSP